MANPADLLQTIEAFRRERGLRSCGPASWDQVCEKRAASMYAAAVQAIDNISEVARRSECDRKTVRDRMADARGLYFKDAIKIGPVGLYELAAELIRFANEMPEREASNG